MAANLIDHFHGRLSNRSHGQGGDKKRRSTADEHADEHLGVAEVQRKLSLHAKADGLHVGGDDGERGERGSTNRKALAEGCGRVSNFIQGIGDLARFFAKAAHLGNPSGIVRHGSVGIHGHGHSHGGEQSHRRYPDTVESGKTGGYPNDGAEGEKGHHNGLHAVGEAGDHDRSRARIARLRDTSHRSR